MPGWWLELFFFCALLLPPLPFPIGDSGVHIAPLVALLGLLAGVVRADEWRISRHANLPTLFVLFLAVLTVSVAFAAVYSGWRIALESLVRVFLFGIGVYVFFYTFMGPREKESDSLKLARFLFRVGLLGAAFACIDFYFQLHTPARFAPQFVWLKHGVLRRAQGVFYEASTLGNFCAFFLVMILVVSFQPGGQPKGQRVCSRLALISGAVLFSAALIASSSRASMITVVVAASMFVWLRRPGIRVIVMAVCALSAAAVVIRLAMPSFSATYWSRMSLSIERFWSFPNEILSGRVTHWKTIADFLAQHPWHLLFGIGYKTLPYTDYIGTRLVADNTYLSLLVETGIVGFTVFAFLNAAILRTAYRAARSDAGRASFFGTWIYCFWCGEAVQMLSGDLITYWRVLPVYFWVLATAARESGE